MQASSRSRSAARAATSGAALALRAADRHLEGRERVVADALEAGEAGVAQLPAPPAVLVGADLDPGEGVLERARHPLRGPVVSVDLLGDLGERHPWCRAAAISASRIRSRALARDIPATAARPQKLLSTPFPRFAPFHSSRFAIASRLG
jgi:hypothetical protein